MRSSGTDFPDAHLNLALALAERGKLEEALNEFEIAAIQAPDDELIQHEFSLLPHRS